MTEASKFLQNNQSCPPLINLILFDNPTKESYSKKTMDHAVPFGSPIVTCCLFQLNNVIRSVKLNWLEVEQEIVMKAEGRIKSVR